MHLLWKLMSLLAHILIFLFATKTGPRVLQHPHGKATLQKSVIVLTTAIAAEGYGCLDGMCESMCGVWTWMSGSNTTYQLGIYGTKGVAAAANIPGAR